MNHWIGALFSLVFVLVSASCLPVDTIENLFDPLDVKRPPDFKDSAGTFHRGVFDCDPCPPGWGLSKPCQLLTPTLCKPCPEGTWSPRHPHTKPCRPCSNCGPGLFAKRQCTATHDTICDSCDTEHAKITIEYVKKCIVDAPMDKASAEITAETLPEDPMEVVEFEDPLLLPKDMAVPSEEKALEDAEDNVPEDIMEMDILGMEENDDDEFVEQSEPRLDEDTRHVFKEWDGPEFYAHSDVKQRPVDEIFPESIASALALQKRKLFVLIGAAVVVFLVSLAFLISLVFQCRRGNGSIRIWACGPRTSAHSATGYEQLQQSLTEDHRSMIQKCASKLQDRMSANDSSMRESLVVDSVENIRGIENPMERYLEGADPSEPKITPHERAQFV